MVLLTKVPRSRRFSFFGSSCARNFRAYLNTVLFVCAPVTVYGAGGVFLGNFVVVVAVAVACAVAAVAIRWPSALFRHRY